MPHRIPNDGGQCAYRMDVNCVNFRFGQILAQQHTSVTVSGWDIASKGALQYETKDNILGGELGGGISGASILAAKFGSRKEALAHTVPLSSLEAQAISEAFFKMSARRFVVGDGMVKVEKRTSANCTSAIR